MTGTDARQRHSWHGDSFEKTCSKCGTIRRKFTGDGGHAYCGPDTANQWVFNSYLTPRCVPGIVPAPARSGRIEQPQRPPESRTQREGYGI